MGNLVTVKGWVPDPSSSFGARLALVRQREGWNRKQAASECGVDPATWAGWENRGVLPRDLYRECQRIAERTGADFVWLMTGQVTGEKLAALAARMLRWPLRAAA